MKKENIKNKKKPSFLKRLCILIIILLAFWGYRHFDELTGDYFGDRKEITEIRKIEDAYYSDETNVAITENSFDRHRNNKDYYFSISEANNNAETGFDKVKSDETDVFMQKCSTDTYNFAEEYEIDKVYSFANFNGTIEFSKDELEDISGKYNIYIGPYNHNAELQKCSYTEENGIITVDYQIEEPLGTYIVIFGSKNNIIDNASLIIENFANNVKKAVVKTADTPDLEDGNFLVSSYKIPRTFFNKMPRMLMVSSGDEEKDAKLKEICLNSAIDMVDADLPGLLHIEMTEDDIQMVSPKVFKFYYKKYRTLYPNNEQIPYKEGNYSKHSYNSFYQKLYWMGYYTYSDLAPTIQKTERNEQLRKESLEKYFGYEDTFSFTNFGSDISFGGNCSGIAYYTMKLFNTGEVDKSGSFNTSEWPAYERLLAGNIIGDVEWDISKDEENKTLLDKRLWDYNPTFKEDHTAEYKVPNADGTIRLQDLSIYKLDGYEKEFVNMIGGYWFNVNAKTNDKDYIKNYGDYWDYGLIEDIMEYIDNNKILQIGFSSIKVENGEKVSSGHSVNVYDYILYANGDVDLLIYDCNYPSDKYILSKSQRRNAKMARDIWHEDYYVEKPRNIMHIIKKNINGQDVFEFDYDVMSNSEWIATNNISLIQDGDMMYRFTVLDENYNFLNEKYMTYHK